MELPEAEQYLRQRTSAAKGPLLYSPKAIRAVLAEYDRRGRMLRDLGFALAAGDDDDRENVLGLLFVEFGMDRAREIMSALRGQEGKPR